MCIGMVTKQEILGDVRNSWECKKPNFAGIDILFENGFEIILKNIITTCFEAFLHRDTTAKRFLKCFTFHSKIICRLYALP